MVRALPLEIRGCRIEAILAVWEAISDMCNIERVLYALAMPERSELIQRVGYLQLYVGSGDCVSAKAKSLTAWLPHDIRWDPMCPDGFYSLDLSIHEHRAIAEFLVRLAIVEPGENWGTVQQGGSRVWGG